MPIFWLFGKRAAPYFIALILHPLLGDYLTSGGVNGGVQLLWPATLEKYVIGLQLESLTSILVEWTFFLASLAIMFKTKDVWTLFQRHPSNLLLSIPIFTVLLPTLLSFPLHVPITLIIPHLAYLALFTVSILIDFKAILPKSKK